MKERQQNDAPVSRTADTVRDEIRGLVAEYCRLAFPDRSFQPGRVVPVAGRVCVAREVEQPLVTE